MKLKCSAKPKKPSKLSAPNLLTRQVIKVTGNTAEVSARVIFEAAAAM